MDTVEVAACRALLSTCGSLVQLPSRVPFADLGAAWNRSRTFQQDDTCTAFVYATKCNRKKRDGQRWIDFLFRVAA